MNLAEWAKAQGISPQTAYNWFHSGQMPVSARKVGGVILVGELDPHPQVAKTTVVYARVSSEDQQAELDRQVSKVISWAFENGYSIDNVVTEIGPVFSRLKLIELLKDPGVSTILVEHLGRCFRFGAEYIEAALESQSRKIVAVDPPEMHDGDFVNDISELFTLFVDASSAGERSPR